MATVSNKNWVLDNVTFSVIVRCCVSTGDRDTSQEVFSQVQNCVEGEGKNHHSDSDGDGSY